MNQPVYEAVSGTARHGPQGNHALHAKTSILGLVFRYGGAVLAVAAATGLRWLLQEYFGTGVAFITFFPTVALIAMLCGGGPSLLATVLSAIAVRTWFGFGTSPSGELVAMLLFIASGLLVSVTAEMLRRAQQRDLAGLANEAEQALRESEARMQQALRVSHSFTFEWHPATDQVVRSVSCAAILKLSGDEAVRDTGQHFFQRVRPDDRERFVQAIRGLTPASNSYVTEYRVTCGDGSVAVLEEIGQGTFDAGGVLVRLVGVATNITERKQAEEALQNLNESLEQQVGERTAELRDQSERLRAILNTAGDAIISIDQRGIIQSVNPAAERLFGYTTAEMMGQNVTLLMPPPYRSKHDEYLRRNLETGEARIIGIGREVAGRCKDGRVFAADLAVSEVEHLRLFTGIIRDITQRKELEREVVEIASQEQRRIGQDLHDTVGQELTGLNLMADTLRNNPTAGAELIERIALGLRRCQEELRIVLRGLLPVPVDTEGLMAALADLANRTQQDGKVSCIFDCPEPVLVADNVTATHFYLIAKEAVHNAVKHARPRNIRITLESADRLILRVFDDGIGIRAQPATDQGVGLRVMRNRAAIIGAVLTFEPAKPSGTLVTCAWRG